MVEKIGIYKNMLCISFQSHSLLLLHAHKNTHSISSGLVIIYSFHFSTKVQNSHHEARKTAPRTPGFQQFIA